MEYNKVLYKVFRWVKATQTYKFVRTFENVNDAIKFCNERGGAYTFEMEVSHD